MESSVTDWLFNEELDLVVQVPARVIAKTQAANRVKVSVNGAVMGSWMEHKPRRRQ